MQRKAQKFRQLELPMGDLGEARANRGSACKPPATIGKQAPASDSLMERVVERSNMMRAWERVKENRGSPGVDGVRIADAWPWFFEHWPRVREELLAGTYQPQLVRRATIPKPGGGERHLGIPTVVDRLIQQAILQVIQPGIDRTFSTHSHGFRPQRNAHGAIAEAQRYIAAGKKWVVDVDLEKFFDRVNHDVLMGRVTKRITDKRLLKLCRRYLEAGVLANGVAVERHEGTPQGGPLSPLLANILLDEVDQELERRGHAFVRYADDLRIYVGSEKAGQRVMGSLIRLLEKLRLRVNTDKSAVARATARPFLAFSFLLDREGHVRTRLSDKALKAFKSRIRRITARHAGRALEAVIAELRRYLPGWKGYFGIIEVRSVLAKLDGWIRRRLRAIQLIHWKRGKTAYKELRARGVAHDLAARVAGNVHHTWTTSWKAMNKAMPTRVFTELKLPSLSP